MSPLRGNAGFRYTPPGGSLTTVQLEVPIRSIHPSEPQTRYVRESEDKKTIDVTTVGDPVHEIQALIRCQPPVALRTMLRHAANGVTISYFPNLAGGTSYPCRLIDARDAQELEPDTQRPYGEYMVTVRLRRVDGGNFDGILVRAA